MSLRYPVRGAALGALPAVDASGPVTVGDAPAPVTLGRAPDSHRAVVGGRRQHVREHRVPSDAVNGSAEKSTSIFYSWLIWRSWLIFLNCN